MQLPHSSLPSGTHSSPSPLQMNPIRKCERMLLIIDPLIQWRQIVRTGHVAHSHK